MLGIDLGLNAVFEVLGRIAEVALDVVLRVAAHAFQSGGHGLHKRFLLLGLLERPGGLQVVDVGLVHRGYGVGYRAADLADEALHLDVVGLCHDELDEHGNALLDAGGHDGDADQQGDVQQASRKLIHIRLLLSFSGPDSSGCSSAYPLRWRRR